METSILYRKILHKTGESFSYNPHYPFNMPLHLHEEYELIYIISGSGKEYIGDTVIDYNPGDLTLIGKNVPHLHLCNSHINNSEIKSTCQLLQFPADIFPTKLSNIPELYNVHTLLSNSSLGIRFNSKETVTKIIRILNRFNQSEGVERIIKLYSILDILSKCTNIQTISSKNMQSQILHTNDPIEKIYTYLHIHFKEAMELKKLSSYIGLNPTSICRLFKMKTGKTIITVLNEIKIEYACKLLTVSHLSNAQIAYECGFNNISYFNKVFKSITKQTPTEYKHNLTYTPI